MSTSVSHSLELSDRELGHLLQLVNKLNPSLDLQDEVPGTGEVEHYHEDCVLEQGRIGEFAVDAGVVILFDHVYLEFGMGAWISIGLRLSGSCMSMTLR